ncbi:MAG: O-antigen ligase family protein [Gemmatimonadaceae bacterium]
MVTRSAAAILGAGLIAIALAVFPHKAFELDRYFVAKELVLHVVALLCLILVLVPHRTVKVDAADKLMAAFLIWSALSAVFATNHWLAQRALALSVSSAVVFWASRRLGAEGMHRRILVAAAVATVVAAMTGLLQAYGLELDYFSENRAPGGTFGNRNFVAHFCALGLPALVYVTVTARTTNGALLGSLSCGAVTALLVLSRSRASWLAAAASLATLIVVGFASRKYWRQLPVARRFGRIGLTAAVAGVAAMFIPNTLNWRSDSPYLETALRVIDYSSGSGRGRVAQYVNSMRMAADDPLLGVGPGNWPVGYVRFAPQNDPSLTDDGMTANPWPSGDWAAFMSERGPIGALALMGVFVLLALTSIRRWRELMDSDAVLAKVTLAGTLVATLVVSAFDAVLLLGAPALLVWSVVGAASGVARGGQEITIPRGAWWITMTVLVFVQATSVARSAMQSVAVSIVGNDASRGGWTLAAAWDPGSYRINLRAAELQARSGRCNVARVHARRARDLFPHAHAPRRILRECGG